MNLSDFFEASLQLEHQSRKRVAVYRRALAVTSPPLPRKLPTFTLCDPPPWMSLPQVCSYIPLAHGQQLRVLEQPYAPSYRASPPFAAPARTPPSFRETLAALVCPVCRCVACPVHGLPAVRLADEGAGTPGAAAAAAVRRDDGARALGRARECSRACWRLLARPVTPLSDERVRATWSRTDARCFARAVGVLLERDPRRRSELATPAAFCLLAQVLRGHTCADIAQYYYYCKARHRTPWEHPAPAPGPHLGTAAAADGGAGGVAELPGAPPVPARLAHTEVRCDLNSLEFFVPCVHSGPCTTECHRMCRECVGEALQLGTVLPRTCAHDARHYFTVPCTRACGCGRACPLQWRGCTCTDACGPRCPCVEAMRECDPDVCSGMHRAAVQGGDPRQHCGNMAFQCCDFRRTVVGLSTTEGAGFGLFAAEACRCNDLILPYSGELLTSKEPMEGRVDQGQYSSSLFYSREISGWFFGNKARFINDGESDERNNAAQRVVFADGQFRYLLRAICEIAPGEELFFSYGKEYWNIIGNDKRKHPSKD